MKKVFDVHYEAESFRNYIDRYNLPTDKTLISGRALEDFTVNDVLFTENKYSVIY